MKVVGVIPAAGQGTRLGPLPFSKELFPLGYERKAGGDGPVTVPHVVSQHVLEGMREAGAAKAFLIVGPYKEDILRYFGDGTRFGMRFSYLLQETPTGMPGALDLAWPWLEPDTTTLFGMPDTLFEPRSADTALLECHMRDGNDVTLGAFPTDKPWKYGMMALDEQGNVSDLVDKPKETSLRYMWGIACWSYRFTNLMHEQLAARGRGGKEIVLSDIFEAALQSRLKVRAVPFPQGSYLDIGTPDDLVSALRRFHLI